MVQPSSAPGARSRTSNSLRSLGRAVEYEAARHVELIEAGEKVAQETRHWDEQAGRTRTMRSKEEAYDYRYFLEPDLVPLDPDAEWQARAKAAIGLLPGARRARLATHLIRTGGRAATAARLDQVQSVVDNRTSDRPGGGGGASRGAGRWCP